MEKKYLAKIIANDNDGLKVISACCSGAKIRISDIKFLKNNKIFLLSMIRLNLESDLDSKRIRSVCKFDYVDKVKSKNIDQKNLDYVLELMAIDYLKNDKDYEINLIFKNNAQIILTTETIEVRLEDQNKI